MAAISRFTHLQRIRLTQWIPFPISTHTIIPMPITIDMIIILIPVVIQNISIKHAETGIQSFHINLSENYLLRNTTKWNSPHWELFWCTEELGR